MISTAFFIDKYSVYLYNCIKELHQDFIDTEQEIWTSLTISIANFRFKMENDQYIDVYPLDNVADKIYARIKNGEHILIEGKIRDNGNLEDVFWESIIWI